MGLDMFIRKTRQAIDTEVDFDEPYDAVELFYFRKHPDLHGWFERNYRELGGKGEYFDCDTLLIRPIDLDMLERDVRLGSLPHTEGFFFGESQPEHAALTLNFVAAAREAIADGFNVYYKAWW